MKVKTNCEAKGHGDDYEYLVAVRNPQTDKTEVYGFRLLTNARAFMDELNKADIEYMYTPKGIGEHE